MTMQRIQPKSQHEPIDIRIPYGIALVALDASSDICTHESNAPIVQIGDNHYVVIVSEHSSKMHTLLTESMKAHPVGQVVRFAVSAKMKCALLRS